MQGAVLSMAMQECATCPQLWHDCGSVPFAARSRVERSLAAWKREETCQIVRSGQIWLRETLENAPTTPSSRPVR